MLCLNVVRKSERRSIHSSRSRHASSLTMSSHSFPNYFSNWQSVLLPRSLHGTAFHRYASVDRGAALGLCFDCKGSVYQLQSFFHANESKALAHLCLFAIKTHPGILDREMNLISSPPQSHFEVPYPTVFCRIVQGFLQHPEEAKRNVRR